MPKISAYPAGTPLQAGDRFVVARGGNNYYILGSEFFPQAGGMRNGRISVTVAGNNLTLALKTYAGADPAAGDPVLLFIGGAWRAITAPLSVTKNAGTNWCNCGSAEIATHEVDFFAYLGYNSLDGITIGFSRIAHACIYSDFSTTSTNEKYAGISTITNASANDEYMNIGRFAATLSAGAGFTWSVPTYTARNLIQRPMYETRWLTWTPSFAANAAPTYTSTSVAFALYKIDTQELRYQLNFSGTLGGSAGLTLFCTLPFDSAIMTGGNTPSIGSGQVSTLTGKVFASAGTPDLFAIRRYDNTNLATSGTSQVIAEGFYDI